MKQFKKWAFLILFLAVGIGYLSLVDHWQVYAEPLEHIREWYEASGSRRDEPEDDADTAGDVLASGDKGSPGNQGAAGGEPGGGTSVPGTDGRTESGYESGSGEGSQGNSEAAGSGGAGEGMLGTEGNGAGEGALGAGSDGIGEGTPGAGGDGAGEGTPGTGGDGAGEGAPGAGSDGAGEEIPETDGDGADPQEPGEITYMTVEDDYFSDAVFIGDSRTMGMYEYGGLEEVSTFYASKGLTVYKIFDSPIVQAPGGKITVEEALQQNTFAKIYLMIGINEMGTGTVETFLEKYKEVVDHLRELQPDALIYLQAIIKVTSERSAKGDYINNEGIDARNEGIALLADNEKIFYLDVNPLICDETGGMNPDYTFDGVHLMGKYIEIWKDYLKAHAISP